MSTSVHTNNSAMIALQNLNRTTQKLEEVQNRINTGLKVTGAKDNASIWAVAQGQRADTGALAAVKMSLDRATSIADTALAAGETISDLLNELKQKVVAAMDPSIDTASRNALNADYSSVLRQIAQIVDTAEFDGANILNGALTGISFIANADADAFITLSGRDLTLGGSTILMSAGSDVLTVSNATAVLADLNTSIASVNAALGQIGAEAKQIEAHNVFVSKLTDVLEAGIGNLVDADLARESARLQALQVQQQLGVQALSIANSAPQVLLALFRS